MRKRQIAPIEATIRERLGKLVFGVDDEELQHAVIRLLDDKRKTLATAESITAGLVAHRLGQIPGASVWFRGGIVAYDNRIKHDVLGVPQDLLDIHGAVSAPVAEAMAVGCRERMQTDFAVSTTGLAGPGGATPDKPIGLVFVGLAWNGGVASSSFSWAGTPHRDSEPHREDGAECGAVEVAGFVMSAHPLKSCRSLAVSRTWPERETASERHFAPMHHKNFPPFK